MFVSVLGIDPGLTRCGYSLLRQNASREYDLERVGLFTTSPQEQISLRLAEMHRDITELITETKPDEIAIERVLFQSNVSTAMSVAQVSGLVHSVAAHFSIPVTEYSPTEVKNAITGDGKADKKQIQSMIMTLLHLTKAPQPADASDAIAIALTHAYSVSKSKKSKDSDSAVYNGSNLHNAIADALVRQAKKQPKREVQERDHKREIMMPQRSRKRKGLSR
jgi:crossover junction endodeoxyribonuclease RuvC